MGNGQQVQGTVPFWVGSRGGQLVITEDECEASARPVAGRLLEWAAHFLRTTLHIVRKPAGQQGCAVIPRRWAVERTLAWLTAYRRLARDYERDPAVSAAMIRWAAIATITAGSSLEGRLPVSSAARSRHQPDPGPRVRGLPDDDAAAA